MEIILTNAAIKAVNDAAARTRERSAVKTLEALGYTYHGGEQWKPPLGKAPDYITAEPLPFDLEAAKAGAPIMTRDGRPAVFVAHDAGADERYRVLARVGERAHADTFRENGALGIHGSGADLFMAPKPKRKVWVNVYHATVKYDTEAEAKRHAGCDRITTVSVEIDA